jgi:hypothetical protein
MGDAFAGFPAGAGLGLVLLAFELEGVFAGDVPRLRKLDAAYDVAVHQDPFDGVLSGVGDSFNHA